MAMICALFLNLLLAWGVVPQLHAVWLSSRAAELVAQSRGAAERAVVLDGYVEPSLVFLLGSNTRIEAANEAAEAAEVTGLALVEKRVEPSFLHDLGRRGDSATALGDVSGVDYSNGRQQHIRLYRVTRPGAPKT
jgi:hypothetical protein